MYAVEVKDRSWFQDLAYNFFANNNICMVWSQLAELRTPPIVTTDFLYVRLIGDRSIDEKDFGKIQKDRVIEMKKWSSKIKRVSKQEEGGGRKNINLAIVSANNHYAGFGPGTANIFRKMVGLPEEATWDEKSHSLSNTHPPIKAKYSLRLYDIKLHNCVLLICCCASFLLFYP